MRSFYIYNLVGGVFLGHYEGDTKAEALDSFAQYAGYANYAEASAAAPAGSVEILVCDQPFHFVAGFQK